VPFAEAEQIVTALKARSLPVTYWPMEAEGHGAVHHANRRALYHAIDRFLTEHLALDGRTERT
jgi:dipeptidyl aminopeptidase/acylaminoacyl peptidase